jgi:hypothetical protein
MYPPHILDIPWDLTNFTGNLSAGFLTFPKYVTETFIGFPLLFSKKAPTLPDLKRFLNLEPFIPLCQFINLWRSQDPQWGTDENIKIYPDTFCTLFKPSKRLDVHTCSRQVPSSKSYVCICFVPVLNYLVKFFSEKNLHNIRAF